jgi:HPt (histidine-containing phosphotransfer) domain-containing protein
MNAMSPFEPLSKLFKGDVDRIRQALEIFERVTRQDLERMDQVYAGRDWAALGRMAHKMRSGCLQIGEASAATRLAGIEQSSSSAGASDVFARDFVAMRQELEGVMQRVIAFLATQNLAGKG